MYDSKKTNWLNPYIQYLFDEDIIEYDMKDAGFNIIKQFKLLPSEKIMELEKMGKGFDRHKAIGILQRDREFSTRLLDKFAEMRGLFVGYNNLGDNNIIAVKKDAIFTIGECKKTKFGGIEFAQKNRYSSYIRFEDNHNIEIYYSNELTDVKGMSESSLNRHRYYILQFLREVIAKLEDKNSSVRRDLIKFIMDYKSMTLDETYYLEFNNKSTDINPVYNYQKVLIPLVQIIEKELRYM
jgi:hypothetical protein